MMPELIEPALQLGVAGLMGMLWVWERTHSRKREAQLDQAHERLTRRDDQVRLLVRLVHRNTRVIERFEHTQAQLRHSLERIHDAMERKAD